MSHSETPVSEFHRELFRGTWGDSCLFLGVIDEVRCKVKFNVPPMISHIPSVESCLVAGKIYRNYFDAAHRANYINSSSRDMFNGAMLGIAARDAKTQAMRVAVRLRKDKGKLCESASDNRNQVGMFGWMQVRMLLAYFNIGLGGQVKLMGLSNVLKALLVQPLFGLSLLVQTYTAFLAYQTHLTIVGLLFLRTVNKKTIFYKLILQALTIRYSGVNAQIAYLNEDLPKLDSVLVLIKGKPDHIAWSSGAAFEQFLSNDLACPLYKVYLGLCSLYLHKKEELTQQLKG